MSEENIAIIRRAVELYNEGGINNATGDPLFDDNVEFREPPEQPAPRVAKGREAVREMFGEFDSAWAEHKNEIEKIESIDDDRVLLLSIEHFKGRDGIEIDAPSTSVFTIRDGRIVKWQSFWDRESALKNLGI
jgi:ketosteroid isomerase-like protein